MTIEIRRPELEDLIQQRMSSGAFEDIEDVLLDALKSSSDRNERSAPRAPERSLAEVFAMVRGLADDLELSRDHSPARPVDLS